MDNSIVVKNPRLSRKWGWAWAEATFVTERPTEPQWTGTIKRLRGIRGSESRFKQLSPWAHDVLFFAGREVESVDGYSPWFFWEELTSPDLDLLGDEVIVNFRKSEDS